MEQPSIAHGQSQPAMRVTVQQPSLAKYRVPFFKELASGSDIQVRVVHGNKVGIPNVEGDGFESVFAPLVQRQFAGVKFYWHWPQIACAVAKETDVLVLTWNTQYLSLCPALLRARKNGVATVVWGHGYSKHERTWRRSLRMRMARLADAVVFYNHRTARQYVEEFGFPEAKCFVALNALDQSPIQSARQRWSDEARLEAFRRQHGLAGKRIVLFVSRFDQANRLDLLFQAMLQLRQEFSNLMAVLIGGKPADHPELTNLCRQYGLSDQVLILDSMYDEQSLAPWFLSADVFCYPENIGLSLLHAFGYGLPVVTCDKIEQQNPEIEALRDNENGLLYARGSVADLAEKLKSILDNDELRKKLSSKATSTVQEEFSIAGMAKGMEAACRFACERVQRRKARHVRLADAAEIEASSK